MELIRNFLCESDSELRISIGLSRQQVSYAFKVTLYPGTVQYDIIPLDILLERVHAKSELAPTDSSVWPRIDESSALNMIFRFNQVPGAGTLTDCCLLRSHGEACTEPASLNLWIRASQTDCW